MYWIQTLLACRGVREAIGAFAAPDVIHWVPGLPKTRSGKILRKIASGEFDQLGDTSTLADPGIVEALMKGLQAQTRSKM
jgi:acetyl-CoA synthetase